MTDRFAVHLATGGKPACGAPGAVTPVSITADPDDVTCGRCQRPAWGDVRPHGTIAAYRRHYRHGEKPCESCRQAELRRQDDYRERLRSAA